MANKIFTCVGFSGYWPVGTSAVAVAKDATEAAAALNAELILNNLPGDVVPNDMTEFVDDGTPKAKILNDGNY